MTAGLDRGAERARLASGRCADPPPPGFSRFEIDADAPGAAREVLARTREVLDAVLAADPADWPAREAWRSLLPDWFVRASAPERTPEEARAWRVHLERLPPDRREAERAARPWSVGNFVYWFQPEQREWWWWGAEALDEDRLRLCLAVVEPSFPHEALDWLLRAAGAERVVDQNVRDLTRREEGLS